ncbi:chitinase [Colletotrichum kahawae]|uniref:chitinase n=1 Tax=Colletotrichum kahawae TaxID=34407 RepID=A0AAD9YME7_COLKA|nr:chitinase [Colletotrichum kahawae]
MPDLIFMDTQLGDYTCGPDKPCSNGACCGEDGWCGYSPTYCGDGCQSNCDAKAECGEFAATAGQTCPLNVCCFEFGFCGTTTDFCKEGCQSNCEQPKPSGSSSDVQQRVIGYWETWNMQKPCGTMGPSEIPVHLLTHLFVSFGYINDAFQVTNMDGIDPGLYKSVGNVKARNPSLKIVIALGGWTFSDPGPWQKVFPTLASTRENRATFIKNLIGFLSEYGYDGVDFADDRGGSEGDGENYTALLKELREAINASGKDYIVTFTAPSSYWYLRHFDLKGMEAHVDWINLMSYDLHGVWDSSNPIGNQVLAHTNLTEIDHALDLFWRVDIQPSSVVLGLGFYGRSFELESASCWKPGCAFKGPGAAGRCSNTAGILSYSEIMDILQSTGATAYHDEAAAAKYLVYADNSWISFDDVTTFQAKIDYANSMGLAGVMIWAIDLDTGNLDALRAISSSNKIGGTNTKFTMVDLDRLFPADLLPSEDDPASYGLVNFGSNANSGETDPAKTGFGFMLVTGDSYAVASLKKREDGPEPLVFLDCPVQKRDQAHDKPQQARVACFSSNIKGCFQLMERGVEGTIIEMPENCAAGTLARAISIEVSEDQTIPVGLSGRSLTSDVYTLTFDFNLSNARRDTSNTRVRMDYSNIRGYWNYAVNSPGVQGGSQKRYHAPTTADWREMFTKSQEMDIYEDAYPIKEDLSSPLIWDSVDDCLINSNEFDQGFAAHVEGTLDARFYYGFSMIATMDQGSLKVDQASGFLTVKGSTDLTFTAGGVGVVDLDKTKKGNPALTSNKPVNHQPHLIEAGDSGAYISLSPYYTVDHQIASFNETGGGSISRSGPYFNGQLSTRVKSDFGDFNAYFPPTKEDRLRIRDSDRLKNQISIPDENVLYGSTGNGGRLALGTYIKFGMKIQFANLGRGLGSGWTVDLPEMILNYGTMAEFSFFPGSGGSTARTDYKIATGVYQSVKNADSVGWDETSSLVQVASDSQGPSDGKVCYPVASPAAGVMPGWNYNSGSNIDPTEYLPGDMGDDFSGKSAFSSAPAETRIPESAAGENMNVVYWDRDMPSCPECDKPEPRESWPGTVPNAKRDALDNTTSDPENNGDFALLDKRKAGEATMMSKDMTICKQAWETAGQFMYPAFPRPAANPWDGIQNGRWDSISKYWGNSSASCSDWSVTRLAQADTELVNGALIRSPYNNLRAAEHVFEGQTISQFFNSWLDKGYIPGQMPPPSNPTPKMPCAIIERTMFDESSALPWTDSNGKVVGFIDLLTSELGNEAHQDRLAIYKSRPNMMKGRMFSGKQCTDIKEFKKMSMDAQLQATKELGLGFEYMNNPAIWSMYCGTYENIYTALGHFDSWYAQSGNTVTIPNLQSEWKLYIETVLKSMVQRSRTSFDDQYREAISRLQSGNNAHAFYRSHWATNQFQNRAKIRITSTCKNLAAINV